VDYLIIYTIQLIGQGIGLLVIGCLERELKGSVMTRKYITTTVPIAGKVLFNLGRWGAYEAAKRGNIQFIEVGRIKRVPVAWMEQVASANPGDLDDMIDAMGD
jgi:hypothetical protein